MIAQVEEHPAPKYHARENDGWNKRSQNPAKPFTSLRRYNFVDEFCHYQLLVSSNDNVFSNQKQNFQNRFQRMCKPIVTARMVRNVFISAKAAEVVELKAISLVPDWSVPI